jgi:hypothetical protein
MLAIKICKHYSKDACRKDAPERLVTEKRTQALPTLVESNNINATIRMTGVAKHTDLKLIEHIGCVCSALHSQQLRSRSQNSPPLLRINLHHYRIFPV